MSTLAMRSYGNLGAFVCSSISGKSRAPARGEAPTQDLQIMRLKRYPTALLRRGVLKLRHFPGCIVFRDSKVLRNRCSLAMLSWAIWALRYVLPYLGVNNQGFKSSAGEPVFAGYAQLGQSGRLGMLLQDFHGIACCGRWTAAYAMEMAGNVLPYVCGQDDAHEVMVELRSFQGFPTCRILPLACLLPSVNGSLRDRDVW
ncbi:unnamed protein product [Toxocara canis]|uniref:Uncharacterized protein n=1 Tax=Toxocara canis TaxID=6265 RepID=A0A183V8E3_TOXCA|nr:unnamed protein product [Toxocara canis]